jgi:phytoene dehydrogenase-like protein
MNCEVAVVGGGIGGLTVAALLAARGVDVYLFERQSRTGGCVANVEHLGYAFEPTAGLYSGWEPRGIYQRIFSELSVKCPDVQRLSPSYMVRLPDQTELAVADNVEQFEEELRQAFPECVAAGVSFYRELAQITDTSASELSDDIVTARLSDCSTRFRSFIDVQLQTLTQCPSDGCSYVRAASALMAPLRGMWAIRGGAQALADALAESLKQSGGRLRLDSPVLRLAYGSDGAPIGLDLLSGERVTATRAIVSNLTIWDTYGKLIGPGRTPPAVSAQLRKLHAEGTYLLFAGIEETAAARLRANTTLALTDWPDEKESDPAQSQLTFAVAPEWDSRAPEGKRAVTVSTYVNAEDWFAFHDDETSHEEQDQAALESVWSRLHQAMPELGDSVEVIETSTPRTVYETTRRKFGMAGKLCPQPAALFTDPRFGTTVFPNVFMIGDTACAGAGLEGICTSAVALADNLTSRTDSGS